MEAEPGVGVMLTIAVFWLACLAVFLELADRAPTLD